MSGLCVVTTEWLNASLMSLELTGLLVKFVLCSRTNNMRGQIAKGSEHLLCVTVWQPGPPCQTSLHKPSS